MKKVVTLIGIFFIFFWTNITITHAKTPPLHKVGGPGTGTPPWCMNNEGPQGFITKFLGEGIDKAQVYFCTTSNGKTRYLAAIKNPATGSYRLVLQDTPYAIIVKHANQDMLKLLPDDLKSAVGDQINNQTIMFELPTPPQDDWAVGPWLVWADTEQIPQNSEHQSSYSKFHKTLYNGNGFLQEGSDGLYLPTTNFKNRDTAIKFWCKSAEPKEAASSAQSPPTFKEYKFPELKNGVAVTLRSNINNQYVNYQRGKGKPIPTFVATKTPLYSYTPSITLSPKQQNFKLKINDVGLFFLPTDQAASTRSDPGFGPFKIVVAKDEQAPSLQRIYLQNAQIPEQFVNAMDDGTVIKDATEPSLFAIEVE